MDLVTCLLDFRLNFASNRSIVPRLAASLAACAQLSALGIKQSVLLIIPSIFFFQMLVESFYDFRELILTFFSFYFSGTLIHISVPFLIMQIQHCKTQKYLSDFMISSCWTQNVGPAEATQTSDNRIRSVHQHKPAAG